MKIKFLKPFLRYKEGDTEESEHNGENLYFIIESTIFPKKDIQTLIESGICEEMKGEEEVTVLRDGHFAYSVTNETYNRLNWLIEHKEEIEKLVENAPYLQNKFNPNVPFYEPNTK